MWTTQRALLDGLSGPGCSESVAARGLPDTIGTILFTPEGATLPQVGGLDRPHLDGWFQDGVATLLTREPLGWEVQLTGSAWCDQVTEVCSESFEPIWMRVEADFDYFDGHLPAVEASDTVVDLASGSPACAPVLPPLWNEDQEP